VYGLNYIQAPALFLLLSVLFISCGGSVENGQSLVMVGPDGGTVTSPDGKASVMIPPGALSQNVSIRITPTSSQPSLSINSSYQFEPSGIVFAQPVTISILYDETTLSPDINESNLVLGKLFVGGWVSVQTSSVDLFQNRVSGHTMGFSTYGVIVAKAREKFVQTGKLKNPRVYHSATLLNNGRVLIAGGTDIINTIYQTVELYNPSAESFEATGNLVEPRNGHRETLLLNGNVLITGGFGNGFLKTAEVYEHSTLAFRSTGSMFNPRIDHTTTLLTDGKVLVTGGAGADQANIFSSAELYVPSTGNFAVTDSMAIERIGHTATLLPDGQVLIAGGENSIEDVWDSAERYDPVSGVFKPTGLLMEARFSHTATLLPNGKVLIVGGG